MNTLILRVLLLGMGLGLVEIAIGGGRGTAPLAAVLLLASGLAGIAAGSAGFMRPLLGNARRKEQR